jgi:hypothetical protein
MTPLRRTILQFSQSFLTDARTFIILLKQFFFDEDAAFGQITGRQFQLHFVPDVDSGQIEPRLASDKTQQPVPIGKFHPIRFVR